MGDAALLRIEVLGPMRVIAVDPEGLRTDMTPVGELQRRLLALLVLHRGDVVSTDAAIDALWPDDGATTAGRRPKDPAAALQTHLFRLRRSLPDGIIDSTAAGYRLDPAAVVVDADDLTGALAAGDSTAVDQLRAALDRWRGPAYPELADDDGGRAEAARLEELRVEARERLAAIRLEADDTDGLVAELRALVDEHPLRETPRRLLMDALHATGRTAEALRTYDDFRRLLGAELGIEPSAALTARHADLLNPATAGAPATAAAGNTNANTNTNTNTNASASAASDTSDRWVPAHRLPRAVTSILGRDTLIATATDLTRRNRLVTLLGFGGVGKTRLLLELGARLREERPDRPVVLCELATGDQDSAVDVVAAALGIEGRPDVGLAERLAHVLADTELVLLLDNCEHVLDRTAGLVERLLANCPRLTMVATSRERLRVAGEQLCPVTPLPTNTGDDAAVRLFVERARAVLPGFDPNESQRACIDELVVRLDGLPLAIELAAARLHTLDVTEVAAGLDRRFRLLDSGSRTTARHRSLGAAVAWSVGLLDDDLRRTFVDLAVFAGPFDMAGAAAVAGLAPADAAVALDQLVERSLVLRTPDRRYLLLETLRAYGVEQLVAEHRADATQMRHAVHTLGWLEHVEITAADAGSEGAMAAIDGALPELRVALNWLVDRNHIALAGRLIAAIEDYGFLRLRPDVLAWAERVTAIDPDDEGPCADVVWAVAGLAAWMAGDVRETSARADRALAVCRRAGRPEPPSVASVQGSVALFEGRLGDAAEWYRLAVRNAGEHDRPRSIVNGGTEVLALAYGRHPDAHERANRLLEEVGDTVTAAAAFAWYCAGEADLVGDLHRARDRYTRALDIAERAGAAFVVGAAGASRASVEARIGDPVAAAAEYRRLLTHWRRAGMWSSQWTMLRSVAGLLEAIGRPVEAATLAGAVVATDAGHRIFGEDEAALTQLGDRLRETLGHRAYTAALQEGAGMDGEAAVELALRSL